MTPGDRIDRATAALRSRVVATKPLRDLANGVLGAADVRMPFGPSKGAPIGELETVEIKRALAWAREKGEYENEWPAFEAVLMARAVGKPNPDVAPLAEYDGDPESL